MASRPTPSHPIESSIHGVRGSSAFLHAFGSLMESAAGLMTDPTARGWSIAEPPPLSRERLRAILHPDTRFLLDSRLVRVEWLGRVKHDPWLNLRVFRLRGISVHLDIGRLYARWSPISRADWRELKAEGRRGRKWRNANRARWDNDG